ncbi:MAG TPA: hypothetical protein VHK69_04000, partial [Chitinophagaceae bacterium]|nr:hypothetical protein [Chitinophagaceae bacterium]
MAKLTHLLLLIFLLTSVCREARAQESYAVRYRGVDADSVRLQQGLTLTTAFPSREGAAGYISGLPALLRGKGYLTASVDSVTYDSLEARVVLFLGEQYKWARLRTDTADAVLLETVRLPRGVQNGGLVDFEGIQRWQRGVLDWLEENGHPFARIQLDSVQLEGEGQVSARLHIDRGPSYRIDSIRVYGDVKVDAAFLQRYLDLPAGSPYNKRKLADVGRKIAQLSYVQEEQPSNLSLLNTGSVLNLHLKPRKSNQVNALVGFLPVANPAPGAKSFRISGEANILLRNALGGGESLGLNWQQLQEQSPRLNILFDQPFLFRSPVGLNFQFDMYRRDSTFLNINMRLGGSYLLSGRASASLFLLRRQSVLNHVDTVQVRFTRRLPQDADVASVNLGAGFDYNSTDYRFNPRRGNELVLSIAGGKKNIRKNN